MSLFDLHTENTGDGRLHEMKDPFWIRRHLYSVVIQYLSVLSGMSIDLNVENSGHRNCKFYESRTTGHAGERMCVYIKKKTANQRSGHDVHPLAWRRHYSVDCLDVD
jgi:hypothetical protein